MGSFSTLTVSVADGVGSLVLNRPTKGNSISQAMWTELAPALQWLVDAGARVIVLSGAGKHFCTGIDVGALMQGLGPSTSGSQEGADCQGRSRWRFRSFVFVLQEAMTAFEACPVPVIAAVHGHCVGAGIDMITACDIRLATESAVFCVKEADLAIVADMGTLQRLPAIVGHGVATELALTARDFSGAEAKQLRLVSQTYASQEALLAGANAMARAIAAKSPLAVCGTKRVLLYQRDHTVADGLDYVATWNSAMLPQSADVQEVFKARAQGRRPMFSRL